MVYRRRTWALTAVALSLAACANDPLVPDGTFSDASMPEKQSIMGERSKSEPISVFETSGQYYTLQEAQPSEPLPKTLVGPIVADGVPITALAEILAAEQGIALTWTDDLSDRVIRLRDPIKRPFGEAIDLITQNAGVFYTYKRGILTLSAQHDFMITIPPVEGNLDAASEAISSFGGEVTQSDEKRSLISFRADRAAIDRLGPYLERSRGSSEVIVFDAWVLEVNLDKTRNLGINWNEFGIRTPSFSMVFGKGASAGGSSSSSSSSSGTDTSTGDSSSSGSSDSSNSDSSSSGSGSSTNFNLGILANPGNWVLDAVASFLQTQGAVHTVSKPTLTMVSGSEADFSVGNSTQYISDVTTTTDDGDTSTGVTTDELETGFKLTIGGIYADGTVYTTVDMDLTNLVSFTKYETGDRSLSLPQTASRTLKTQVQARPGDILVLGGMIQEQKIKSKEELPLLDTPTSVSNQTTRSELVILLRPRIIQYRPKAEKPAAEAVKPISEPTFSKPAQEVAP